MPIIKTQNLTKTFRRFEKSPGLRGSIESLFHRRYIEKKAVSGFDLTVEPGEFIGLIGPNGAGKTTLVKMLTGIIAPTSGDIDVLGFSPNKLENAFKRRYAVVMGQKSQLFFELTAADTFQLFQALYEIPDDQYRRNVTYFTELFAVQDLMNVQVRTLSLGERMKLELIVALLHDPTVLFLDEPTIGLDAVAQRQMRGFLRQVNQDKDTTILLTSHYMEDVRSLCPRSVVINDGQKLYDGATDALFDAYQTHKRITLQFASETGFTAPENTELVVRGPLKAVLLVPKSENGHILADLMRAYDVQDVTVEEDDIGAVVERIYARGGVS